MGPEVSVCMCGVVSEAGCDIQFQNLHVMEKARWGFKVISFFLYSYRISLYPQLDFVFFFLTQTCCFMETKKSYFFLQIESSYSFSIVFFYFLRKQIYAFLKKFFLHLLSKQS